MKSPIYTESGPDNADTSQPNRDTESKTPDIKEPQEPDTSVVSSHSGCVNRASLFKVETLGGQEDDEITTSEIIGYVILIS